MDLVSVVIPAHNSEKTVGRAVNSLLNQSYPNIDIIIVDDGSLDGTKKECIRLAQTDNRIRFFSIEHGGVSNARNTGLENVAGSYIAFLDADDFMEAQMIEKLLLCMREQVDLVCCGYSVIEAEGKKVFDQKLCDREWEADWPSAIERMQEAKSFNALWNKLFKAEIIRKHGIKMNTEVSMGEDVLFVIDYMMNMEGGVTTVKDPLYRYTLSANGLQASIGGAEDFEKKMVPLRKLESLYSQKGFQKDGLYVELMRCIYIAVLESGELEKTMHEIYRSGEFQELCGKKIKGRKKYRFFLELLKHRSVTLVKTSVWLFYLMKRIQGRVYDWK